MKYYIFSILALLLFAIGCKEIGESEVFFANHAVLTAESNANMVRIDNDTLHLAGGGQITFYDQTTNASTISRYFIMYPINDTGYVKIRLFADYSLTPKAVQLRDSLIIKTPSDTIIFAADGNSPLDKLKILNKK